MRFVASRELVGLVAARDGHGLEGIYLEVTVLAEQLDEGALAGGVEDEMGLAVGTGLGGEQGAEPGGQAEVVRAERDGFGVDEFEMGGDGVGLGDGVAVLRAGEGAGEQDDGGVVLALAEVDADVDFGEAVAGDAGGLVGLGRLGDEGAVEELGGGGDEGALVLLGVEGFAVELAFGGEEVGAEAGARRTVQPLWGVLQSW